MSGVILGRTILDRTILETERLRLCALGLGDAAFILRLVNEPSWLEHIGDRHVHDLEGARRYLRDGPLAMYERHGFGLYRIERKADAASLGMCGLLKREQLEHADIGYALLPEFCGAGYALEATTAVLDYGNRVLALQPIAAITTPSNRRSIALLDKLGLHYAGMLQLDGDAELLSLYLQACP